MHVKDTWRNLWNDEMLVIRLEQPGKTRPSLVELVRTAFSIKERTHIPSFASTVSYFAGRSALVMCPTLMMIPLKISSLLRFARVILGRPYLSIRMSPFSYVPSLRPIQIVAFLIYVAGVPG